MDFNAAQMGINGPLMLLVDIVKYWFNVVYIGHFRHGAGNCLPFTKEGMNEI